MKILALGASTSSTSINRQLAHYAAKLTGSHPITELDISNYQLPIFSEDQEKEHGIPTDAEKFLDAIRSHDAIIISLAEHNGSYTAAFKNLYDWTSRIEMKLWSGKPLVLLATSPGPRGAATVLAAAEATFPHMGADIRATFSLPSFYDHFSDGSISDEALNNSLKKAIATLNT